MNIQAASQAVHRIKTEDLRRSATFKKISEFLGIDGQVLSRPPKRQILIFVVQNCENSAVKHSIDISTLLCFLYFFYSILPQIIDYYHPKRWNYELRHAFPNDLRLGILGNQEILKKCLKYLDFMASTQPVTWKINFDSCARKLQKISGETFHFKTYFT